MKAQVEPATDPDLGRRASRATLKFIIALAVIIFVSAGSLDYWQGWLLWGHMALWCVAMTWYFLRHDRALLERRMAGPAQETQIEQRRIQAFTGLFVLAIFIVSPLDYRFGWSVVPLPFVVLGHILVALGFGIILRVFQENTFAASTIGVAAGQRVISTGPYALVRHPMYGGAVFLFLGIPLALGSWVGLLGVPLLAAALVARLRHEELYLSRNLPGYDEYRRRIRWRLVPGLW